MKTITYDETQWKLVPLETVTEAMRKAISDAEDRYLHCDSDLEDFAVVVFHAMTAAAPDPPAPSSPIDSLVDRFAEALREKLHAAEAKYGYNDAWARDNWRDDLIKHLHQHIAKGDPRDVAAYCAFAWHHGWSLAPGPPAQPAVSGMDATRQIAYLDIGIGYLDLGSDLSDDELMQLPKGRHALGVIGTYGIAGFEKPAVSDEQPKGGA